MALPVQLAPGFEDGSDLHILRYNFKPAGIAATGSGKLSAGKIQGDVGAVQVELPASDGSHSYWFQGQQVAAKSTDCVLLWDEGKQCYIMHRLASITRLTHSKDPPPPIRDSPSPPKKVRLSSPAATAVPLSSRPASPDGVEEFNMGGSSEEDEIPLSATLPPAVKAPPLKARASSSARGKHKSAALVDSDDEAEVAVPLKEADSKKGETKESTLMPQHLDVPSKPPAKVASEPPASAAQANGHLSAPVPAPIPAVPARAASPFANGVAAKTKGTASIAAILGGSRQGSPATGLGQRAMKSLPVSLASSLNGGSSPLHAQRKRRRKNNGSAISIESSDSTSDSNVDDDEYKQKSSSEEKSSPMRAVKKAAPKRKAVRPVAASKPAAPKGTAPRVTAIGNGRPPPPMDTTFATTANNDNDDDDLDFADLAKQLDDELLSRPASHQSESDSA